MDSKKKRSGLSSLLVPCVQELAKEPLKVVPPRYVRPENEPVSAPGAAQVLNVPVIDMQRLLSPHSMHTELESLHSACKDWGFFQLVNHGVSSSLLDKLKMEIQEFFDLPMEEKKKFWQTSEEVQGFGQAFVVSEEQKLDWADLFFMITLPNHLRKPHLFPNLPLPFRDTLELYSVELKDLAMCILEQIAKALKMEAKEMEDVFEGGTQSMRMNYYPPCPEPEKVIGLSPHSDAVGLTILLQVSDVEGLQIRKDGMWVPVKPLPNAFVINVGDIVEILTNGAYRSIEHRAIVNSSKERLSVATFYNPWQDAEIGPASSLISKHKPARFKRISYQDYQKGLFSQPLDGKAYLDAMRIPSAEEEQS